MIILLFQAFQVFDYNIWEYFWYQFVKIPKKFDNFFCVAFFTKFWPKILNNFFAISMSINGIILLGLKKI
jgi:hypothetical protein